MNAKVTQSDQQYFGRLGRANRALDRTERPPGSLKEALCRMARIEQLHGIDMRSPEALKSWPDRQSHIAYLKAVKRMAAKERNANAKKARGCQDSRC